MSDPLSAPPAVPFPTPMIQGYSERYPQPGRPPSGPYAASPWASQVVGAGGQRPPGAWVQPPAPRPVAPIRTRWIVLSVLGGLAVLGLVATLGVVAAVRQGTGPQVAAASAHKGDLEALVVPAPDGSRPWRTAPQDETLDLDTAAQLPGESAAATRRVMLKRWSFVRGYARRWTNDKVAVQVALYQFADETSAAGFARDDLTSDARSGYSASTPIDGTDNGIAMVLTAPSSGSSSGTLGLARVGDIVVAVLTAQASLPDATPGNQVVVAQVNRL